jgi:hypothetical protein
VGKTTPLAYRGDAAYAVTPAQHRLLKEAIAACGSLAVKGRKETSAWHLVKAGLGAVTIFHGNATFEVAEGVTVR